jgi:catechol 2,3-dioxygenase-like lactoylglutathione lyase family enzyme
MYSMNHVGLTVSDIKRSARFYAKFGFEPEDPPVVDTAEHQDQWIRTLTAFPDAHLLLALMEFDGVRLELIQYVAPTGKAEVAIETPDAGSAHLAFSVDDIDAAYERLRREGVVFRSSPVYIPEGPFGGVRSVYFEDPDGNTVEMLQGDF